MTTQTLSHQEKLKLYNSKKKARGDLKIVYHNLREILQNNVAWDKEMRDKYDEVITGVELIISSLNTEINQLYKSLN